MTEEKPPISAAQILMHGIQIMQQRAQLRDSPEGERSMARTVAAFNVLFGHELSETDGWHFMECLKMARRAEGKVSLDDFVDGAAYSALAGESAIRDALANQTTPNQTEAQQSNVVEMTPEERADAAVLSTT